MKENKNNLIQIPLSKNRLRHSLALAGLILLLGVGLFGLAGRVSAQTAGPMGTCTNTASGDSYPSTEANCTGPSVVWKTDVVTTPAADPTKSDFEKQVTENFKCGLSTS